MKKSITKSLTCIVVTSSMLFLPVASPASSCVVCTPQPIYKRIPKVIDSYVSDSCPINQSFYSKRMLRASSLRGRYKNLLRPSEEFLKMKHNDSNY